MTTDPAFRNQTMISAALGGREIVALETLPDRTIPDVALIGFGGDRHIASIFPAGAGMDTAGALDADAPTILRTVPDPLPAEAPFARLTFTLAALARTPRLFIAARGGAKRAVFQAALSEEPARSPLARLLAIRSAADSGAQVWLEDDQADGDRSA
jgi:6-phosphogluconolactonase/glucosamine-6-phosphate isomerase/deaminase